jgi:hypothetical protein
MGIFKEMPGHGETGKQGAGHDLCSETSPLAQHKVYQGLISKQDRVGRWTTVEWALRFSQRWDIIPCSPLNLNRRFGGTCRFHLQGAKINQARNQHKICSKLVSTCFIWFLAWIIFRPWRCRRYVTPKSRLDFNRLLGVITPKIKLF